MPKEKTKPVRQRQYKYDTKWEAIPSFRDWIRKSYESGEKAHCKFCNSELRAHKSDLDKHIKTAKHIDIEKIRANQQRSVPVAIPKQVNISAEQKRKRQELKLALFTAIQATFR